MNNQSPLMPLGSMMEQKNKGRARVKIAVSFVLIIHGIGLLALLVQGCHKDDSTPQKTADQTPTEQTPQFATTNTNIATDAAQTATTQTPVDGTKPAEPPAAVPIGGAE